MQHTWSDIFRKELIAYYNGLMAAASLRERKALWRVQRHRLEQRRVDFLEEKQNELQKLVDEKSLISASSDEVSFDY